LKKGFAKNFYALPPGSFTPLAQTHKSFCALLSKSAASLLALGSRNMSGRADFVRSAML
jgi:hypothetical protein